MVPGFSSGSWTTPSFLEQKNRTTPVLFFFSSGLLEQRMVRFWRTAQKRTPVLLKDTNAWFLVLLQAFLNKEEEHLFFWKTQTPVLSSWTKKKNTLSSWTKKKNTLSLVSCQLLVVICYLLVVSLLNKKLLEPLRNFF